MLGKINALGGKVVRGDYLYPSYFEQEVKAEKITPIDDVWNAFPSMEQAQVRAALARAGLKPTILHVHLIHYLVASKLKFVYVN